MNKPLLIAASVALALSITACDRAENRAERENMAPGANIATTPPPSSPVDTAGAHSSGAPSSAATGDTSSADTGGTSGMGAAGVTSGPDTSAKGADSTTGMGTNPQVEGSPAR